MLAAGHKAQTEAGLIQHHIGRHKDHRGNDHEPVELKAAPTGDKGLLLLHILDGRGHIVGIGGGVDGLDDNGGTGGAQQVQGRAHDGLVSLEVDAGHGQQRGIDHTGGDGAQQHHDHHQKRRQIRHIPHGQCAAQCADDHDALQAQVDDAGMLGEAAAQSHQHQHGGED